MPWVGLQCVIVSFHRHTQLFLVPFSINRQPYMSVPVLLNLLNTLRKIDKMRGSPSILSLFRNKFDKFNNTGARMLDSIYHMTLKLLKNCNILPTFTQRYNGRHYVTLLISKPIVFYRLHCMALYHSQRQRYVIKRQKCTLIMN